MEPKKVYRFDITVDKVEVCFLIIAEHENAIFFAGVLWLDQDFKNNVLQNSEFKYKNFMANNFDEAKSEAVEWIKDNISADIKIKMRE